MIGKPCYATNSFLDIYGPFFGYMNKTIADMDMHFRTDTLAITPQLHRDLLIYSIKDERHRGEYKTNPNHVSAFDADGKEIGVIFETATPFDTPRLMEE